MAIGIWEFDNGAQRKKIEFGLAGGESESTRHRGKNCLKRVLERTVPRARGCRNAAVLKSLKEDFELLSQ
jgi:hypothetical protein